MDTQELKKMFAVFTARCLGIHNYDNNDAILFNEIVVHDSMWTIISLFYTLVDACDLDITSSFSMRHVQKFDTCTKRMIFVFVFFLLKRINSCYQTVNCRHYCIFIDSVM